MEIFIYYLSENFICDKNSITLNTNYDSQNVYTFIQKKNEKSQKQYFFK